MDFSETETAAGTDLAELWSARKFEPTAKQRLLYEALARTPLDGMSLVGYGGAMGGGKTRALCELALDTALSFPGTRVLLARHRYTTLRTTTMEEFFGMGADQFIAGRDRTRPESARLRRKGWPEGVESVVYFRHLTEWTGLGSEQYGAVFIDEAGEVAEQAAQMLITRLRHPAQRQRWFVAASNPWPGWFQRWFAGGELPAAALARANGRVEFIPARVEDNKHLPPHYAETQRSLLPRDWVERFIDGKFDAFAGLVYPHFDPERHRWNAPAPEFSAYVGGIDHGAPSDIGHMTAAIVAGLTKEGLLIRLAEFEQRGPNVSERLERWMAEHEARLGRPVHWRCDRSQGAWIEKMQRGGTRVAPSQGGPGSVNRGIGLVQARLADREEGGGPGSRFDPLLEQFAKRMREYSWEQPRLDHEGEPKPRKVDDDLVDADRYMHEEAEAVETARRRQRPLIWELIEPDRGQPRRRIRFSTHDRLHRRPGRAPARTAWPGI